ncbi:MAG: Ig-like domain-containing protein [Chlamydiia bacterium]|nr:Ig-like domain-containing protein [Chlamydiia bacterium]
MKKHLSILILALTFLACSGDGTTGDTTVINTIQDLPDTPPAKTNTKSIYYKNDFLNDANLTVTEDNIALYKVSNLTDLNESIPFLVDIEGDYEFCSDGAQKILVIHVEEYSNTGDLFFNSPIYTLSCKRIHLTPGKYKVRVNYRMKIKSMYDGEVPYIRLFEKIELKSDLTSADWENGKTFESGDLNASLYTTSYRYCYKTPINSNSYISLWRESNKFTLSFRTNLDDGTVFRCTYLGTTVPPQYQTAIPALSDIGDIDTIVSELLNSTPSMIYSRPSSTSTVIDVGTNINIKFRGAIDGLTLNEAFSISPHIDGTLSLNGDILTFNPDNNLDYMTKYRVQLKGLKENNIAIADIDFSFTTHESYTYNDSNSSLYDYELCAVGISSYCSSDDFSTITSLGMSFPDNIVHGSRSLDVNITLDKATPINLFIDYALNATNTLLEGTILVEEGSTTASKIISFPISSFTYINPNTNYKTNIEENATLKITKIKNAHTSDDYSFEYIVKNGEFFKSPSEVNASEEVEINNMYFSDDNRTNKIFTIELDKVAVEDVDVEIHFVGTNKVITSCNGNCASMNLHETEYKITTIKKGTTSVDFNFTFSTNKDAYVYSEYFDATVKSVRNASVANGLAASVSFVVDAE